MARRRLSPEERIRRQVERWFLAEPLLFAAWTTHRLVRSAQIATIRVCAGRIEYNPAFVAGLDARQLAEVLTLEALRIVLKHPYARRRPSAALAYCASNLALQECLHTSVLPYAREVLGSSDHDQQFFEYYYRVLLEELGRRGTMVLGRSLDGAPLIGALARYADADAVGAENAGLWGPDDLLVELVDAQIRNAEASAMWGTLTGRLKAHILASLRPKVRYRDVLRRFRTSILTSRRYLTRMRPSRRYGFACMGSRYARAARLLVAIDVSGSMSDADLEIGFSIVNRFFTYAVPAIDLIQFDTEVKGPALSLRRARGAFSVVGRGGTSFQPVIDYVDEHRGYDGVIIFTDGWAPVPRPPRNRRTRIVWLFKRESCWSSMAPGLAALGHAAFVEADH